MNKHWSAAVVCTFFLLAARSLGNNRRTRRRRQPAKADRLVRPPGAGGGGGPPPPMSFFVTSVGIGRGGNLGGLAGADAHCQSLAAAAGRGNVTWHAYLSTQGPNAVNARDRIGNGPWYNQRGQMIAPSVAELHGDTLEQARIGNFIGPQTHLTKKDSQSNGFPGTSTTS